MMLSVETFKPEMTEALRAFEKYIVCVEKTPDEFQSTLARLVDKAIKAYATRGPGLRHGLALDRHLTVILSQTDDPRPLCAIYFNLHSPHATKKGR